MSKLDRRCSLDVTGLPRNTVDPAVKELVPFPQQHTVCNYNVCVTFIISKLIVIIGWTEQLSSFYKNKAKSCLFTARLEVKAKTYHFLNQTKKGHIEKRTFFPPGPQNKLQ